MMYQLQKELAVSYRLDLVECIASAAAGQLSPSDQEYCLEEIGGRRGSAEYPEDGDELLRQLRSVLSGTPQISEQEHEAAEVASFGGKLLFFHYLDRYTLLELAEQPDGAGYDSFVFISAEKHGGELERTAAEMKAALDAWLERCGVPCGHVAAADHPNLSDLCRCGTLEEAVSFLYTALHYPESILT